MLVWNAQLIVHEKQTLGKVICSCLFCGPVDEAMPLVRFDLDENAERYPYRGICGECVNKAQRAADHRTAEAGLVRIGSPYRCTHCRDTVTPVVWFDLHSTTEQYVCARCLVEAQRQFLVLQDHLSG